MSSRSEEGVVGQNLVETFTIGQKFENVGDTKALTANAGTAPALAVLDSDSLESVCAHIVLTTLLITLKDMLRALL
jgi:hypothetical protein